MDTTKTVTHISLCAGYGGIDLGLKRAIPHLRTIAFSEIEAFACANLVAKMEAGFLDAAPIWTDVKTFPWPRFHGKVDILSGGYPCQPFSAAGKRLGKDDPRHLWPWIADGIRLCQPSVCFFENVEGHISLGLREVIGELEEIGYRATWGVFSAAEVGAPHQRKRVFILADDASTGLERLRADTRESLESKFRNRCSSLWPSRPGQPQFPWEPPRVVGNQPADLGDTQSERTGGLPIGAGEAQPGFEGASSVGTGMGDTHSLAAGRINEVLGGSESQEQGQRLQRERTGDAVGHAGENQYWQTEPALGGDADGASGGMDYAQLCVYGDNRTDELRLLGNGVVPATAERAFRILSARFIQ
jgi:DNA (cytosine-5)-methyltransferase 1